MVVTVRYFAVLRERRGVETEDIQVDADTTISQLYARLFPPTAAGTMPVLFAVNQCYVDRDHCLSAGDEVAFIPPLGGG
ncbi:MAG: MoaD/ThiS family protein [Oligoflexia bacterium]|nr:MoaD/ThiS family protein [Oligoflexia bacterium]